MGWTGIARREHSREGLRYPSDMTEREWVLTSAFIPAAKTGGRRRTTDMRGCERAAVHRVERRRVADVAQMLSAGVDGTALFPCVAEHWIVRDDQQ